MIAPPLVRADMFTLCKQVDVHICDSDSNDVGVDGFDEEVQHKFLLASNNILDFTDSHSVQRFSRREEKAYRAKYEDQ